jgi:hypothetical protein
LGQKLSSNWGLLYAKARQHGSNAANGSSQIICLWFLINLSFKHMRFKKNIPPLVLSGVGGNTFLVFICLLLPHMLSFSTLGVHWERIKEPKTERE